MVGLAAFNSSATCLRAPATMPAPFDRTPETREACSAVRYDGGMAPRGMVPNRQEFLALSSIVQVRSNCRGQIFQRPGLDFSRPGSFQGRRSIVEHRGSRPLVIVGRRTTEGIFASTCWLSIQGTPVECADRDGDKASCASCPSPIKTYK